MRRQLMLALFPILCALPQFAFAAVPHRIHYQGLLTTNSGVPISTARTVYFSVIEGGDATTVPSGGTLRYREHITLTPDVNGVFEHAIGSGLVDFGTLTQPLFNTANPIYLEIAITDPNVVANILIPRSRFDSVAYSLMAEAAENAIGAITPISVSIAGFGQVIDSSGNWIGAPITSGLPGSPSATLLADDTGGRLVVGDILRIQGSGLNAVTVEIGGLPAPLVGATTTGQLKCQIPQGVRSGLNDVVLINTAGGATRPSTNAGQVDVRRLLVAIRSAGGSGVANVIDPRDNTVLASIALGSVDNLDNSNDVIPLQAGFAHQGALLLVPSGFGQVFALDLTDNPPSLAATLTNGSAIRAIAASPDGRIAAACDFGITGASQLKIIKLGQLAPPYSAGVFSTVSTIESTEIPSSFGPSGVIFPSDTQMLVLGRITPQIIIYHRVAGTDGTDVDDIERITATDLSNGSTLLTDVVGAGTDPVRLQMTHDKTRLLLTTRASNNLAAYQIAPFWPTSAGTISGGAPGGNQPLKMAISPDDQTIFVATRDDSDTQAGDRLKRLTLDDAGLRFIGEIVGPRFNSGLESFQIADIEPVEGNLLAAATNDDKIFIVPLNGGSVPIDPDPTHINTTYLSLPGPQINLSESAKDCLELVFQP